MPVSAMDELFQRTVDFIRQEFGTQGNIALHEPRFTGNEKKYVMEAIESTFVSSVGQFVTRFEEMMCSITGAPYAVATMNGTSALHVALRLVGVERDDEVIVPPLSFVATANAVLYCGATPLFIDVDRTTLGLSPQSVVEFLKEHAQIQTKGSCLNKLTGRRISACVPVHVFGHPCRVDEIAEVCAGYGIPVVEDAAESIGSLFHRRHTGTFGVMGVFSFNGNKTVTSGAGGAIITADPLLAARAKHITTTAKVPHPYEYVHDEMGYNYRMPNLNAALACAQLEQLDRFIACKRNLAKRYAAFFEEQGIEFVTEPRFARSNYWLNAIILQDRATRDQYVEYTNQCGVMTRPAWRLLNTLPMFQGCQTDGLAQARWLEERIANIPSSAIPI